MHCVACSLENELKVCVNFLTDIEAQIREIQGKKAALDEAQGVGLDSTGYYDQEIYGGSDSRFAGYVTSIAATELEDVSTDYIRVKHFKFIIIILVESKKYKGIFCLSHLA